MKEFTTRNMTAAVLIVIAYTTIQFSPPGIFAILILLLGFGGASEMLKLAQPKLKSRLLVFGLGVLVGAGFFFKEVPIDAVMAAAVIFIGLFFLFALKKREDLTEFVRDFGIHMITVMYLFFPLFFMYRLKILGPNYLFFLIAVIAIGDSFAYFIGSLFAKLNKKVAIYPVASPNKSLQGVLAATVFAALSAWPVLAIFPLPVRIETAVLSAGVIGLFSQLSDPVESLFKRAAGKKDSGSLLPGHGGILDRIDSYIFCAPILFFAVTWIW